MGSKDWNWGLGEDLGGARCGKRGIKHPKMCPEGAWFCPHPARERTALCPHERRLVLSLVGAWGVSEAWGAGARYWYSLPSFAKCI